jgi:Family of unknown function (DUF6868)
MLTLESLMVFFGWCSVINILVLVFSTVSLLIFKGPISAIHSRMFGVDPQNIASLYFQYLANYKVAIFMLNIVPYLALRIML